MSGAPRRSVYLEANAIGHLVPPEETSLTRRRRSAIDAMVRRRKLEVIASPILLQELAKIGRTSWPAHLRVLGYLRSIASPHLLHFLEDLVGRELRAGHGLRRSEARRGRSASDEIWAIVSDRLKVQEVIDQLDREAERFHDEERRVGAEAALELRLHVPHDGSVESGVWEWWSNGPTEHIRWWAQRLAQTHGRDPDLHDVARLPALWRFAAYRVARIALMHARRPGGGLKRTDGADAHHYASAAYADVFVSDDGPLHRTAEAIPGLRRPITLDVFARDYLRVD